MSFVGPAGSEGTQTAEVGEALSREAHERLELAKAIYEVEKARHDARIAQLEAERHELELVESRLDLHYGVSGVFTFHRAVDSRAMRRLYRAMRVWDRSDPDGSWVIYLNSVGGDVWAGIGIIDELVAQSVRGGGKHHVTVKVRGVAASAAAMILQAADLRLVGPNSQLMIHKGSASVSGTADEISDEHAWWSAAVSQMADLFLSRSGGSLTRREFMRRIDRKDWWLSASEAVSLGLADGIG